MSDENRNYPPAPPAPPSSTPQDQTAATAQGGPTPAPPAPPTPAPQQNWQQGGAQQGWQQPPAAPQQPPAAPQQNWQPPAAAQQPPAAAQQPPAAPQQNWQQPGAPQQPQQSSAQQSWQQTHEKLQQQAGGNAPTWEQIKASGNYQIPKEYPADKFNPESFSIPALLLSWIWYMVKGMWQKGLVILVAEIVVFRVPLLGFLLYIGIAIYAGMYGHRDYMRFHNSKQQFWF